MGSSEVEVGGGSVEVEGSNEDEGAEEVEATGGVESVEEEVDC